MALGETRLLAENHDYFLREGFDLNAFDTVKNGGESSTPSSSSLSSKISNKRSDVVVVVKNLPASSDHGELTRLFSRFGAISKSLLAPSKTVLVVEFLDPFSARRAFKGLAYKRYQHSPLYLEWAPLGAVHQAPPSPPAELPVPKSVSGRSLVGAGGDDDDATFMNYPEINRRHHKSMDKVHVSGTNSGVQVPVSSTKLLVKNVPFAASAKELRELFASFGAVKALRLPKKFGNGNSNSSSHHRGYAFVEYVQGHEAKGAMAHLANTHLYGRHLVCSWAAADGDGNGAGETRMAEGR